MKKVIYAIVFIAVFGMFYNCTPTTELDEPQSTEKPGSTNTGNQADPDDGDDNGEG